MEQACGWLRWTPDAFWNATLSEVHAGAKGFAESKGVKRDVNLSGEELDELYDWAAEAAREERRAELERNQ